MSDNRPESVFLLLDTLEVSDFQAASILRCKKTFTFANHIRSRSNALINLAPFPHHYQNVLKAIAYIDWQSETGADTKDYQAYLEFAGVSSNETAIAYLDWLEARLRRKVSCYEQMLNCHKHEIEHFIKNFDLNK